MAPIAWLFGLLAFLLWMGCLAACHFAHLIVGRAFGMRAKVVSIGIGPTLLRKSCGDWQWRVALLPLGGYTQFLSEDDKAGGVESEKPLTGRFEDASPLGQALTVLVGPFVYLLTGFLLLGWPIWGGAHQLAIAPADQSMVRPCAVGGLTLPDQPSTWAGQWRLLGDTAGEFSVRVVTFQSLENWGGLLGFFVTCGAVGAVSAWAWLTCLGIIFLAFGVYNLLPVPCLNGFLFVCVLYRAVSGRPVPAGPRLALTYLGLLVLLVVCVRVSWIDLRWLWRVLFG